MNLVEKLIKLDRKDLKRILVVGDGMTDVYVNGRMEDSCQEGCPKFIEESRVSVPGGAANAARSLGCWTARVLFFGMNPGITKTRFMLGDRCLFRHDVEDRGDLIHKSLVHKSLVRKRAIQVLLCSGQPGSWEPDAVLLSDYDKGVLTPEFIAEIVDICKGQGIPCVADAKREPEVYYGAVVKANYDWYMSIGDADVITHGSRRPLVSGVLVGRYLPPVKCINHVGAGDCFAAHLTLALAHGFSLEDAATLAYSAGRVYVQFEHNRPPRPEEIQKDMEGY